MTMTHVDVAFIESWEREQSDNPGTPAWGDWEAMAAHLAQWDNGTESDAASTDDGPVAGPHDDSIEFTIGGLVYTLTVNTDLEYAALSRLPLESE